MKTLLLVPLLLLGACTSHHEKKKDTASETAVTVTAPTEPVIVFEVTQGILHPESAFYSHRHKQIFVSNITSGNPLEKSRTGYISQLDATGKVIKSKWVEGLRAPKGIAVVGDELFVADINEVARIHIPTARITKRYSIPKAKFLNDVAADERGNVYISDTFDTVIYGISQEKGIHIWLKDERLRSPNGLMVAGKDHLLVGLWGSPLDQKTFKAEVEGGMMSIPLDQTVTDFREGPSLGHLDGVTIDNDGTIWISDWMNGNIHRMSKQGKVQQTFNFGQGTADIFYARELGLLLVPQMLQNKVIAIRI